MRYLATLLVMTMQLAFAGVGPVLDDNDPESRRAFLDGSNKLAPRSAAMNYYYAIQSWRSDDQRSDLVAACWRLYGLALRHSIVEEMRPHLEKCPEQTLRQMFSRDDSDYLPISKSAPTYPLDAQLAGREGWVVVEYDIDIDGSVKNVRAIEYSHKGFVEAAVESAEKARYRSRVVDGQPVVVEGVRTRILFQIQ